MTSELPDGLEAARQAWQDAANEADPEAYAKVLAEHAVWIPPGMDAIEGREAIATWLSDMMAGLSYELTLQDVEVQLAGWWARESGRFTSLMTAEATGETMTHDGRYLVLWHATKTGTWRIDRYVDLTEVPDQG